MGVLHKLESFVKAGAAGDDEFRAAVLSGLARHPKTLEPKFFYDERGSQLFDAITELEEYYPTRAETAALESHAAEIAAFVGRGASLVEFGSGSSVKTRLLLENLAGLRCYVPIDISGAHLQAAAERLAADYALPVIPVHADYTGAFALPDVVPAAGRLGFFPGSTIGNFDPPAAVAFLRRARDLLGPGARFLVGADLQKDAARLVAAYDDAQGVTAAFNLNLLRRINRELAGDFDLAAFRHEARYDPELGRIEMHLVSRAAQQVTIAGHSFSFAAGESIHTENSYKYTLESFADLARQGGWRSEAQWLDPEGLFSLHGLVAD
ncbi:L-histidine N(alpha)-methyltransferase [Pelagibius marinus]|uniref:L-histidine N(alpha)-methyltransferase n=1 Tax=Pelagibius marinus TaxID=2762760 RepID=UPI0018721B9B|nr:L-histidine N(alpha)-methyltransferase [Pelagibius marinus]